MTNEKFDFSGWVTKNNVLCTDGRVIEPDAFKHMDGKIVSLVWNHEHQTPFSILGNVLLKNHPEGVKGYGSFNHTEAGEAAKEAVMHGDIKSLSICANHVKEVAGRVMKGMIKEVSLVHSGANKDAVIDLVINHGDGEDETEAYIFFPETIEIAHADTDKDGDDDENESNEESQETVEDVIDSLTKEQQQALFTLVCKRLGFTVNKNGEQIPTEGKKTEEVEHADGSNNIEAVIDSLDKNQLKRLFDILADRLKIKLSADGAPPMAKVEEEPEVKHADEEDEAKEDTKTTDPEKVYNSFTDEQKDTLNSIVADIVYGPGDNKSDEEEKAEVEHADGDKKKGVTAKEFLDTLNEDQKAVAVAVIANATKVAEKKEEDNKSDDKGETDMKYKPFEDNKKSEEKKTISHADMDGIFKSAQKKGSFREALKEYTIEHADGDSNADPEVTYGFDHPEFLFPDAKAISPKPEVISRDMEWVDTFLNAANRTPFAHVKSILANITADDARARGYLKGTKKKDEVIKLMKRDTPPTTVYKKQKMDRDDLLDITDFDKVAWIRAEMETMLKEELARACLVSDGRGDSNPDKIDEDKIRPIYKDNSFYTIRTTVAAGEDDTKTAKNVIQGAIRSRKNYKGSGNMTAFVTEDFLTGALLLEDGIGRRYYNNEQDVAVAMRCKNIVSVPVMENQVNEGKTLAAILLNPKDYNIGTNRGGQITSFNDFDIEYNQERYLIETRLSGALVKPYSAIVIEVAAAAAEENDDDDDQQASG